MPFGFYPGTYTTELVGRGAVNGGGTSNIHDPMLPIKIVISNSNSEQNGTRYGGGNTLSALVNWLAPDSTPTVPGGDYGNSYTGGDFLKDGTWRVANSYSGYNSYDRLR